MLRSPTLGLRSPSSLAGCLLAGAGLVLTTLPSACLERPVTKQSPTTSNIFTRPIRTEAIKAIDLLFVIDNSGSMADKQAILRKAVPLMVSRLVTPDCVGSDGTQAPNDGQNCASYGNSFAPEFQPIEDIHIGVITSSIGGFGSPNCSDPAREPQAMDKSLLIPKVRSQVESTGEAVPDPNGKGFLAWNGVPEGTLASAAIDQLQQDFALQVAAAGEDGCGFEAPLEAWYRFLIDPSPPAGLSLVEQGNNLVAASTGVDQAILTQRAEFLRPGSLVAIVVLTDENDCSAMEGGNVYRHAGNGWLVADQDRPFPLASRACEQNPNDACCHSCLQPAPSECEDTCDRETDATLPPELDRANARCFDNQRRFGIDLLYPTDRYVRGLSQTKIVDSQTGAEVPNPLLQGRSPDLVFFAGIVGVPWQDIATQDTLHDPGRLEYLNARELSLDDSNLAANRWDVILGEPGLAWSGSECRGADPRPECGKLPIPPLDPFMIESIGPRSGTNPIIGAPTVAPGSTGWSVINGHEYDNAALESDGTPANDDLQYSCIFPLAPKSCEETTGSCDCSDEPSKNRPLCKPTQSASAAADTTQRFAKAYPASRILRVLRDFGENSIVGSICPKILDEQNPDFGYNPAVNAIVDRLRDKLTGQCLPRELSLSDGKVPCRVVEALTEAVSCPADQGRQEVSPQVRSAVLQQLAAAGHCTKEPTGTGSEVRCDDFAICEIREVEDNAQGACFGSTPAENQAPGYCYIDPAKGPVAGGLPGPTGGCLAGDPSTWSSCTNPNLVGCGATQRRMLRFVGRETPKPGAVALVACVGEAASSSGGLYLK